MDKKNFLFVSPEGLLCDTAWQVSQEGHAVRIDIEGKQNEDIADGFIDKIPDWKSHIDWADVIIFEGVQGMGKRAQELRKKGKAVIGGTPYTDQLEDDRSFGQKELIRHGVKTLPQELFTDYDVAMEYVRKNPCAYVIKPSEEAQDIKRLLFVGDEEDGSDVIRVLEAYKRVWSKKVKVFQLQKRVRGVEIGVGAFFNGRQFIEPININFEHKKLFNGNIGPATGEMGTSMFWSSPNKLFHATLKKMEPTLAKEGYVGYIDINTIVNAFGIYPLEFTARFGYPTISIQHEGMLTPMGEFLYELAHGRDPKLRVKTGFQVGVRLRVPPYPYNDKQTFESFSKGATIVFKKKKYEGIHIEDTKQVNEQWIVAGSIGAVMTVTGSGVTMKLAKEQAYRRIENLLIPNMYYRTDIGDRWEVDSDRLHSWGYLREH